MARNYLIHPGGEHRPLDRCVGYGIPHADGCLAVACWTCKAPVGQPCTRRGPGSHTTRTDRARRLFHRKAHQLFRKLENAALARDPDGPLWSFQSLPHRCGALGPHVLTDCTPEVVGERFPNPFFSTPVIRYDGRIASVSVDTHALMRHLGEDLALELSEVSAARAVRLVDDPDRWFVYSSWFVWCRAEEVDAALAALRWLSLGYDWDARQLLERWRAEVAEEVAS